MQIHKHHEILKKFGARVRQERLKSGISQEDLAGLASVHRTYIGMIERGEKNVTLSTMINIAGALEIDVIDLIKGL